MKLGIVATRGI